MQQRRGMLHCKLLFRTACLSGVESGSSKPGEETNENRQEVKGRHIHSGTGRQTAKVRWKPVATGWEEESGYEER